MTGHGTKLGRMQEQAIAALIWCHSLEKAAHTTGVSVKTLVRWQKIPSVAAAYREARQAVFAQTMNRLTQASGVAVSTLLTLQF
jgi:hypothetical protein